MEIDRWLLEQHSLGLQPSTIRFYTWQPAAISLGYHQKQWPDHWQSLTWQDKPLDLVRRSTGGRAVLHQGDLTYALITSGLSAQRREAYRVLCQFLLEGWRSLGFPLFYGNAGQGYIHNPNCFGTATAADLVLADGSKFIGSAQLWRGRSVLQHGSMQLCVDPLLFEQVFGVEKPSSPLLETLKNYPLDKIVQVLTEAAQATLGELRVADLEQLVSGGLKIPEEHEKC